MPPTYYPALLFVRLVFTAGSLLFLPSEFWGQVVALLNVPNEVKVVAAPLLGSACATVVEYIAQYKQLHQPPAFHWPLKLFVGWVAGAFGGTAIDGLINASPQTLAFWAGISGYGSIALYLANQQRKINDTNPPDNDAP